MSEQLDELRSSAKIVNSKPASELLEKTKLNSPLTIEKVFADFQTSLHAHLADVRNSLLEQTAMLQDVQKAVEISRQQLELQRNITLAADSLDQLVEENTTRAEMFESDMERKKQEIDEQMAAKKKIWEREMEEYEYQKKLARERDQIEAAEREKTLEAREAAMRAQELEVAQMKKTIEGFPAELESTLVKRECEVTERLTQQSSYERALLEKETSAQARLLELTVKNLEERLAAHLQEITSLKQQTEEANAKSQELAIKAIERPTTIVAATNNQQPQQPAYHERSQTRGNG